MKPHPEDRRYWPYYRTAISVHEARKRGQVVIKLPLAPMKREDLLGLPVLRDGGDSE